MFTTLGKGKGKKINSTSPFAYLTNSLTAPPSNMIISSGLVGGIGRQIVPPQMVGFDGIMKGRGMDSKLRITSGQEENDDDDNMNIQFSTLRNYTPPAFSLAHGGPVGVVIPDQKNLSCNCDCNYNNNNRNESRPSAVGPLTSTFLPTVGMRI